MKHELVFENTVRAKCSCGEWTYVGLNPEGRAAVEKVYAYHLPGRPKKVKKRK